MDPISILSGLIVNKAVDIILKKTAFQYINRKALEKEFHKIMSEAIRKTADGKFAEYFIREKGSIDDSFWKNERVVKELWGTFTDLENTASIPDFTVLYEEYYKIYTEGQIAPKPFEKVIDVGSIFWRRREGQNSSPRFSRGKSSFSLMSLSIRQKGWR